ncbi:MAG: hypothetical protein PUI85_01250 [Eubacteriales bacterium]|nr:hypothetical protein [Eubacteriales bacterium]MDY3332984.1 hypothetical protein [Gallibacter sp.]
MIRIKVLIISKDDDYKNKLMQSISSVSNNINLIFNQNIDAYNDKEYDIVILDEDFSDEYCRFDKDKLIILYKNRENIEDFYLLKDVDGCKFLYKYCSLDIFLSNMISFYNLHSKYTYIDKTLSNINTKLYSVVSYLGGSGCTSFAISLARDRCICGEKVLFVSLRQFAEENIFFNVIDETDTYKSFEREFIYNLLFIDPNMKSERNIHNLDIQKYLITDQYGVYYFRKSFMIGELNKLNDNELNEIFSSLIKENFFDKIIVDIGNNFSKNISLINNITDNLFIVEKYNNGDDQLFFNRYITKEYFGTISNKIIIENMSYNDMVDGLKTDIDNDSNIIKAILPMDKLAFNKNNEMIDISLDTSYGIAIRNIFGGL